MNFLADHEYVVHTQPHLSQVYCQLDEWGIEFLMEVYKSLYTNIITPEDYSFFEYYDSLMLSFNPNHMCQEMCGDCFDCDAHYGWEHRTIEILLEAIEYFVPLPLPLPWILDDFVSGGEILLSPPKTVLLAMPADHIDPNPPNRNLYHENLLQRPRHRRRPAPPQY